MTLFALLPVAAAIVAAAMSLTARQMRNDHALVRAELFDIGARVLAIAAGVALGLTWSVR